MGEAQAARLRIEPGVPSLGSAPWERNHVVSVSSKITAVKWSLVSRHFGNLASEFSMAFGMMHNM